MKAACQELEAKIAELGSPEEMQKVEADYNLSPSRWVGQTDAVAQRPIAEIIAEMQRLDEEALGIDATLARMLVQLR